MTSQARQLALPILLLWCGAIAQAQRGPSPPPALMVPRGPTYGPQREFDLWAAGNLEQSPLEEPSGSVSRLDFKAPGKARQEYRKGYVLLTRKDFAGASQHLAAATSLYPQFVAAHNALGVAYLKLGQNSLALEQFATAVSLDDHLPGSYLNLGCAQLALKDYGSAEQAMQKASSIAPLDLPLTTALVYAQLMNQDYAAVGATTEQVHSRKHEGAAIVHYYAAAAWQSQNNLPQAQTELETFLREDPKSPAADPARQALDEINALERESGKFPAGGQNRKSQPVAVVTEVPSTQAAPTPEQVAAQLQFIRQEAKEKKEIAEAEAEPAEGRCATCGAPVALGGTAIAGVTRPVPAADIASAETPGVFSLRSSVDEVGVLFSATDHGRPVTDLRREQVEILDDRRPPSSITGFRNEAELPLRLGIIIDTSASVTSRFAFEQRAAIHFLQKVLTHDHDLAFVVGVANSVLLVQDFTNDQQRISHAVDQLAPAGGTALWDAVNYAAQKLASRPETQPVARMLIVISDGKDNSSSATLTQAIASAQSGEAFVYTVSAGGADNGENPHVLGEAVLVGDRALKVLSERTGGAAFLPNSIRGLDHGLDELQQVIRSRYLISYKPAHFKADGQYRAIDISAQKSGHKLRVYARRGYYARVNTSGEVNF
jgi:VWFA-related protein